MTQLSFDCAKLPISYINGGKQIVYMLLEIALLLGICVVIYIRVFKKNPEEDIFMNQLMAKQAEFQESLAVEEDVVIQSVDVTIIYSTQTGNALYYSKKLHDMVQSYNMSSQVINVGKIYLDVKIPSKLIVFVVSTFGDGDPSDDGVAFFKKLKESDANSFTDSNNVILGIGSTTYPQFNQAAKILKKYIGLPLLYTEIDETKSLEMEYYNFSVKFEKFLVNFGEKQGLQMQKSIKKVTVNYDSTFKNVMLGLPSNELVADRTQPKLLRVVNINKIFESDRICWHIEFDADKADPKLNWEYGDHIAVYSQNSSQHVNEIAEYFKLNEIDKKREISVITGPTILDGDSPIHSNGTLSSDVRLDTVIQWEKEDPKTLRTLLTFYIDLSVSVPLLFIEKLKELGYCGSINDAFYKDHIYKNKITLIDFLQLFQIPSTTAVLECILLYMPRITARWYSISSSERFGDSISICVVTVGYELQQPASLKDTEITGYHQKQVKGLCTDYFTRCNTYLEKYHNSQQQIMPLLVPVFTRKSNFKIPKYPVPMLWVGPGTGVAPFRGLLRELKHRAQRYGTSRCVNSKSITELNHSTTYCFKQDAENATPQHSLADNGILYLFGCRGPKESIYTTDFEEGVKEGIIDVYDVAYSRTTDIKCYVQHRLTRYEEFILAVVDRGYTFICGDTGMAREVEAIMEEISKEKKGLRKMKNEGRLLLDVWG